MKKISSQSHRKRDSKRQLRKTMSRRSRKTQRQRNKNSRKNARSRNRSEKKKRKQNVRKKNAEPSFWRSSPKRRSRKSLRISFSRNPKQNSRSR